MKFVYAPKLHSSRIIQSQLSWYGIFHHPLIQMRKNDHCAVSLSRISCQQQNVAAQIQSQKGVIIHAPTGLCPTSQRKNLLNFLAGRNLHFPFFFGGKEEGAILKLTSLPSHTTTICSMLFQRTCWYTILHNKIKHTTHADW